MADSYAAAESLVMQWATEYLTSQGLTGFDVYVSSIKFVITLSDGFSSWWLYNARQITQAHVVGEIAIWLMNRAEPPQPRGALL